MTDEYMTFMDRLDAGQVSEDEADEMFDRLIADVHEGRLPEEWRHILGLTDDEATIVLHGGSWREVAERRRSRRGPIDGSPSSFGVGGEWGGDPGRTAILPARCT